jgi:hypothetical protein
MISDREDKKMARFLPLLKRRKENKCRSCKNQLTLQNKNNLTQELRYSKIKKVNDRKKALEERIIIQHRDSIAQKEEQLKLKQ